MVSGLSDDSSMDEQRPYSVPLIPVDLRPEETMLQVCNSLAYLEQVSSSIFSRIAERVQKNRDQLSKLNDRITLAQLRVDRIKGTNKATRVFSSAKYPAGESETNYESVFGEGLPDEKTKSLKKLKTSQYTVKTKLGIVDDKTLADKRQYYNVNQRSRSRSLTSGSDQGLSLGASGNTEGLGRLPRSIDTISSLLLFNTSENPYKKYVTFDPLGVVTKTRRTLDDDDGVTLTDAPSSIREREEMIRLNAENFSYMPGLGAVPELSVPDFLPDLLGVADDLKYSAELSHSIAPSLPGSNMPDLPTFSQDLPTFNQAPPDITSAPPTFSLSVNQMSASVEAPPPPPPPPIIAPPPPPPPPPPPVVAMDVPTVQDHVDSSAASAGSANQPQTSTPVPAHVPAGLTSNDSRASLMDAIRQAGGANNAKLRKTAAQRKHEQKKKRKEEEDVRGKGAGGSGGGGDLMSDLAAKLQLRRKGMAGSAKREERGSVSKNPLDRLSSIIPPPPAGQQQQQQASAADDDWN